MKLIDTHCHIHDSEFFGDKRQEVYDRAIAADIAMITVGTDEIEAIEAHLKAFLKTPPSAVNYVPVGF